MRNLLQFFLISFAVKFAARTVKTEGEIYANILKFIYAEHFSTIRYDYYNL